MVPVHFTKPSTPSVTRRLIFSSSVRVIGAMLYFSSFSLAFSLALTTGKLPACYEGLYTTWNVSDEFGGTSPLSGVIVKIFIGVCAHSNFPGALPLFVSLRVSLHTISWLSSTKFIFIYVRDNSSLTSWMSPTTWNSNACYSLITYFTLFRNCPRV